MLNSATRAIVFHAALVVGTISLAQAAHGDEYAVYDDQLTEATPPPFPIVHRILKSACGRCHQDGHHRGGIQLNTPMQVNRDAAVILQSIETGSMPYMDPTWNKTRDAQVVIRYLKAVLVNEIPSEDLEE